MADLLGALTFDGTNGTELSTSNTWTETGSPYGAGSATLDTSVKHVGTASAKFVTSSNYRNLEADIAGGDQAVGWFVFYLYITANPSTNIVILQVYSNNTPEVMGELRILSTGKLQLRDVNTARSDTTSAGTDLGGSSGSLGTSQWHRVAVRFSPTAGTMEFKVYSGANLDGSTPTWSSGSLTMTLATATTFDNVRLGILIASTATVWFDDYHDSDTSEWVPTTSTPAEVTATAVTASVAMPLDTATRNALVALGGESKQGIWA